MPNGRPGDHPLTDIIHHKIETYGPDADEYIRGINEFSSRHELYSWWEQEIKNETDRQIIFPKGAGALSGTHDAVAGERLG